MHIDLSEVPHTFHERPLLFAGGALEYYGIRKAGNDLDFLVCPTDYRRLVAKYPENVLSSPTHDHGVSVGPYEFWEESCGYYYADMINKALWISGGGYLVISLQNLLFLKALNIENTKAQRDIILLARYLREFKTTGRA